MARKPAAAPAAPPLFPPVSLTPEITGLVANLPVETLVRDRQAGYCAALNAANATGHAAAPFVVFMLTAIRDALAEAAADSAAPGCQKTAQKSSQKILALLRADPELTIAALGARLGLSGRAVKNHLANPKALDRLRRIGPDKGGRWEVRP